MFTSAKALIDVVLKFKSAKAIYEKEKGTGRPILLSREFVWIVLSIIFTGIAYQTGTNVEDLQTRFSEIVFLIQYNIGNLYDLYANNKPLIVSTFGGVTATLVAGRKLLEVVKELLGMMKKGKDAEKPA